MSIEKRIEVLYNLTNVYEIFYFKEDLYMITIEGKSVFGGVSIGKLMFYKRNEKVIRRTHVDDVDAEWKRFEEAKGIQQSTS